MKRILLLSISILLAFPLMGQIKAGRYIADTIEDLSLGIPMDARNVITISKVDRGQYKIEIDNYEFYFNSTKLVMEKVEGYIRYTYDRTSGLVPIRLMFFFTKAGNLWGVDYLNYGNNTERMLYGIKANSSTNLKIATPPTKHVREDQSIGE